VTVADRMSALKHDEPSSHSAVIPQELDKTLNKGVMIQRARLAEDDPKQHLLAFDSAHVVSPTERCVPAQRVQQPW